MAVSWPAGARQPIRIRSESSLSFNGFPYGVHTSVPPFQISVREMSECVNFNVTNLGGLETRRPLTQYTKSAVLSNSPVKFISKSSIGDTDYELLVDANFNLYYLDANKDPIFIGTLEGDATILPYNGVALLLDGSYIKYLDDSLTIKIAYDDGTGPAGYQFDNQAGANDDFIPLGNGTNERVAFKFTALGWDSGYTIPPTTVTIMLSKEGDLPVAPMFVRIRKVSDDTIVAASPEDALYDVSLLDVVAVEVSYTFTSSDIVSELDPSTEYYLSLEFTGGNSTNYVKVHCSSAFETANAVKNGGFLDAVTPPEDWTDGNDAVLSTEAVGLSGNCLKVLEDGHDYPYAYQDVDVTAEQFYKVMAYVKKGTQDIYKMVVWDIVNGIELYDSGWIREVAADWSSFVSVVGYAPVGCTSIRISLYSSSLSGEGTYIYFDSVTCCKSVGGTAYYYDGTWHSDASNIPIFSLRPGLPPKASFGRIKDSRPFLGGDPDNPGYVWFGNLTHLDWSTVDGGGYVGAVDDNRNTYAVGAIETLYGDLYVYGKENQPYLCKLSGSTPSDYVLPALFQHVGATHRTLRSVGNDLWAATGIGVSTIQGVQEYGDIRAFFVSDSVGDRFVDYWDTDTAISGYNPIGGQYMLYMPNYHRVLVAHTKLPFRMGVQIKYPWVEYEFTKDILTSTSYKWTANGDEYYLEAASGGDPGILIQPPFLLLDGIKLVEGTAGSLNNHEWDYGLDPTSTFNTVYIRDDAGDPNTTGIEIRSILAPSCFATYASVFYIGGSDGYIYKIDDESYLELDAYRIRFDMRSAYVGFPFSSVSLIAQQVNAISKGGGQFVLYLYRNAVYGTPVKGYTYSFPIDDRLTVDDMIMDVDDYIGLVDPVNLPFFKKMNANARSIQVRLTDLIVPGYPININAISFKYRRLEF
jgi:hypothetical protein